MGVEALSDEGDIASCDCGDSGSDEFVAVGDDRDLRENI